MADEYTGYQGFVLVADQSEENTKALTGSITASGNTIDETLYGKNQCKEVKDPETGETKSEPDAGQHGKLDRIRFCHWAAPEWGPEGENKWTLAFQAAELAVALLNAQIQGQIADMQQDLAEGYYQQAKYKWDRFANNYMPLERAILWEAQSEPIRELDCADDRRRATSAVIPSFDIMTRHMAQTAKGYRLCPDPTVTSQLTHTRSQLLVDTENYNLLDDQWFTDFKNDQRWARRSNILNLGRNLGSVAMQYGDVARRLMSNVSDIVNKAAGSLSQALGYYGSRFDTFYPMTYLSGTSQNLVTTGYRGTSYSPSGVSGAIG